MTPYGAHQRLHARRTFGGLAEIYMLDGRQYRSEQVCGRGRVSPCEALWRKDRTMLGVMQERWLDANLAAPGARWNILAQQTVFAHMDQQPGPESGYWNDGWSGYPAARQRLVETLAKHSVANPVILSGDVHSFLVNDVHSEPGNPDSPIAAAEFVTSSISSNGPPQSSIESWITENPNVRFGRGDVRGYIRLSLSAEALRAELVGVADPTRPDSAATVVKAFDVEANRRGIAG